MDNTPKKATDILLEMESKIDAVINIIKTQDFNIKILSNKLNNIIELLGNQSLKSKVPTIEPVNVINGHVKEIPVSSDFQITVETEPKGFQRSSRPETYSGDNSYLPTSSSNVVKNNVQMKPITKQNPPPPGREAIAEVVVPQQVNTNPTPKKQNINQNAIPVSQRVVNESGKSLFLADVEIIDTDNMQPIFKTRTNGTGKWSASLATGNYRIIIHKRESSTNSKMEATQNISINGNDSKVELPIIIIK